MSAAGRVRQARGGFTLIEMLVSVAILLVLMSIIFQVIQMSSQAWKTSTQGTSTMQQARSAFERMTRNLSQATLNTYYNYFDKSGKPASDPAYNGTPAIYGRQSELQFMSGSGPVNGSTGYITTSANNALQVTHGVFFQAALGDINSANSTDVTSYGTLDRLLNACGYFVIYGPDTFRPPFFSGLSNAPPNENRFRLMEYLQPSESLSIYTSGAIPAQPGGTVVPSWISNGLPSNLTAATPSGTSPVNVRPLASNVVALIILPEQFSNGSGTNVVANETNVSYVQCQSANSYNYDSAYSVAPNTSTNPPTQAASANQLPPLVKVIMVAIDEPSALRLAAAHPSASSTAPPDLGDLSTSSAPLFQDPSKLFTSGGVEGDLEKFEDVLNAKPGNVAGNAIKLNYSVFQTDVIIRSSKWSQ